MDISQKDISKLNSTLLSKYIKASLVSPSLSEYNYISLAKNTSSGSNLIDEKGNRIDFEKTVGYSYDLGKGTSGKVLYANSLFTFILTSKGHLLASTYKMLNNGLIFRGWIETMYPYNKICSYYGNDEKTFLLRMRNALRDGKGISESLIEDSITTPSVSYIKKSYPELKSIKFVIKDKRNSLFRYECEDGRRGLSTYDSIKAFIYPE